MLNSKTQWGIFYQVKENVSEPSAFKLDAEETAEDRDPRNRKFPVEHASSTEFFTVSGWYNIFGAIKAYFIDEWSAFSK